MAQKFKISHLKINLLFLLFILGGAAIVGRLFLIQIIQGEYFQALAQGQHKSYEEILPQRGEVFIKGKPFPKSLTEDFDPLITNKDWPRVYLRPNIITEPIKIIEKLSSILELAQEVLAKKVEKRDDPYEPLTHKLSDETVKEIEDLNLEGVEIKSERLRYYPFNSLASHVTGFLGYKEEEKWGQYGLEEYYNKELEGSRGHASTETGLGGTTFSFIKHLFQPPRDGDKLILTIDHNVQFMTEKILKEMTEKWQADAGTIIVMEPSTGKILAMASLPNFDPNDYSKVEDINVFLNPAIQARFEPGSIFKPITMAAALNEGVVSPSTTYVDEGEVKIGGYTIKNFNDKVYGLQTMTQVLEFSINTGAIFAEEKLGHQKFKEYLEEFGLEEKTGIDLEGEISGDISNLDSGRDINFATASFGQGIVLTPIELITALSAIANKGKMMKPYVVEQIIHSDGTVEERKPEMIREVISSETASRLTAMMISVVKNGFSKKAQIPGYFVAGKTGTAQVPREDGQGYSEKTIHSFSMFAPAFNPKFIALFKIDYPKGIGSASDSITPFARELGEYILNYYQVLPD